MRGRRWARLYPNKLRVTAVQLLNNDVLPTFEANGAEVDATLCDNGREFCWREDQHPHELFLQLEGIAHRRTQVKRPQSNGIVERLHRTLLDEHFRVDGRCTWFETIEEMQVPLGACLKTYNESRAHQGRGMKGRTPLQACKAGIKLTRANKEEPTTQSVSDVQLAAAAPPLRMRHCQPNTLSVHAGARTSASATRHERQYRMRRPPIGTQSDGIGWSSLPNVVGLPSGHF